MFGALGSSAYEEMDVLSTQIATLTVTESTTASPPDILRYAIDTLILPFMRLEDVCAYGQADHRGAKRALIEVQKRGYSWLPEGDTQTAQAIRVHLRNVREAVMCGKRCIFNCLTSKMEQSDQNEYPEEFELRTALRSCKTFEEALLNKDIISKITRLGLLGNPYNPILLPPELGQFTGLTHLRCAGFRLKMISPVVLKCKELVSLDLSFTTLTILPPYIGKCEKLQFLWLINNRLVTLPSELNECKALRKIEVQANPLDKEFRERIHTIFPKISVVTEMILA